MNFAELLIWGAAIGLGATVFTDLAGLLRHGWTATNEFYCLVGRWVGSVARGGLAHTDIRNTPSLKIEAALGWTAHLLLGLLFGIAFAVLSGPTALHEPKAWQGLTFGLATVLVPWFVFQPLFGWGVAVSKAPEPWRMRLRGLTTHLTFGLGIWLSAMVLSMLIG